MLNPRNFLIFFWFIAWTWNWDPHGNCKVSAEPADDWDPLDIMDAYRKLFHLNNEPSVPEQPATVQQLIETALIRNEINRAVKENRHVIETEPFIGSKVEIKQNGADHEPLNGTVLSLPNIIDTQLDIESNRIGSLTETADHGKERLIFRSIIENLNFNLGDSVRQWKTISYRSKNGTRSLIGMTDQGFIVVGEQGNRYFLIKNQTVSGVSPPDCLTIISYWNETVRSMESLVILSVDRQIEFYSLRNNFTETNLIWIWSIQKNIFDIEHLKLPRSNLLTISSKSLTDISSIDIYEFDFRLKNFHLIQSIATETPTNSLKLLSTGRDHILAFVQSNIVPIYQFGSLKKFEKLHQIESRNVTRIETFQMGGYSYLAVGGLSPKIFKYNLGKFESETVISDRWYLVEDFLPIPARTYRDDLILLVQHRIEYGSDSVSVVEPLIWNGKAFDLPVYVPCYVGGMAVEIGLTCLLDYERSNGISGSTILPQTANRISVIIPRYNATSGLFELNFELESNEVGQVMENLNLKQEIKEQEERLLTIKSLITSGLDFKNTGGHISNEWSVGHIETEQLILTDLAQITQTFLGSESLTKEDFSVDIAALNETLFKIQETLSIHDSPSSIPIQTNGKFDLSKIRLLNSTDRLKRQSNETWFTKKLFVKNLQVDEIDGEKSTDFIFVENSRLRLGNVSLDQPIDVIESVVIVNDNPVIKRNKPDELGNIWIKGDLEVKVINDIPWEQFEKSIVLTNVPNFIDKIDISGELIVFNDLSIFQLNGVHFPDDFVLKDDTGKRVVSGRKEFAGILKTNAIDCSGTINKITTLDVITLSQPQYIQGLTTIKQLEVMESLNVLGNISGSHLNDFLPNPNLLETNEIQADVLFENDLIVDGPIFILDQLNEIDLETYLGDIVYRSESDQVITGFKTFDQLDIQDIDLSTSLINGIEIEQFVTKNTEQMLTIDRLNGSIIFRQVNISGLFNFINITELDENSIKLSGEQFTEAEVIIQSTNDQFDLYVNEFEVSQSLNEVTVDQFVRIDDDVIFESDQSFDQLFVKELNLTGSIVGDAKLNGVNLTEFNEIRLSKSRDQEVVAPYIIESAVFTDQITVKEINDRKIVDLFNLIEETGNYNNLLSEKNLIIEQMIVENNVTINFINEFNFNDLISSAIWLNRPNEISGDLKFNEKIFITGNLTGTILNERDFNDFVNNIVLRDAGSIHFRGEKIFNEPLEFGNVTVINTLNSVSFVSFLNKIESIDLPNDLIVEGDITIDQLYINPGGKLNGITFQDIERIYCFDYEHGQHVVQGDIEFDHEIYVKNLQINGGVNDLPDFNGFLSTLIQIHGNYNISGKKVFTQVVQINDCSIANYNSIDLFELLVNVNLFNENQIVITGKDVVFPRMNSLKNLYVNEYVYTKLLGSYTISEWMADTVRIDRYFNYTGRLQFGAGAFRGRQVNLVYLNGKLMADVVTLNTEQKLRGSMVVENFIGFGTIDVSGSVNGRNLKSERENTLKVTGNQLIESPINFQEPIRVLKNLKTESLINNHDLKQIASIHETVKIQSPLTINSLHAENLFTDHQISGIDFNDWFENSLWKQGRSEQVVTGPRIIDEAVFSGGFIDNSNDSVINGKRIADFIDHLNRSSEIVTSRMTELKSEHREVCKKIKGIIQKSNNDRPILIDHFDVSFTLIANQGINSIYLFSNRDRGNYLIVNGNCLTILYEWSQEKEIFLRLKEYPTGVVNDWTHVETDDGEVYLISNSLKSNCPSDYPSGCNVWSVRNGQLFMIDHLSEPNVFIQFQRKPNLSGQFLTLLVNDTVRLYNVTKQIKEWKLPSSGDRTEHQFIPDDAQLGVSLSNGERLSVLTDFRISNQLIRKVRTISFQSEPNRMRKRFFSETFRDRLRNATKQFFQRQRNDDLLKSWFKSVGQPVRNEKEMIAEAREAIGKEVKANIRDSIIRYIKINSISNSTGFGLTSGVPFNGNFGKISINPPEPEVEAAIAPMIDQVVDDLEQKFEGKLNDSKVGDLEEEMISFTDQLIDDLERNGTRSERPISEATFRDADGTLEDSLIPLADDITDDLKNFVSEEPELTDKLIDPLKIIINPKRVDESEDLGRQLLGHRDKSMEINTTSRDAIGDLEGVVVPLADKITDDLKDIVSEAPELTDKLIDTVKGIINKETDESEDVGQKSGTYESSDEKAQARDVIGDLESLVVPLTDKITDDLKVVVSKDPELTDKLIESLKGIINKDIDESEDVGQKSGTYESSDEKSQARDVIGDLESLVVPLADKITDDLKVVVSEKPELTDKLIESLKGIINKRTDESEDLWLKSGNYESDNEQTKARDALGDLETSVVPLSDKITDDFKDIVSEAPELTDKLIESLKELIDKPKDLGTPLLGDKFGTIESAFTPFADNITDKWSDMLGDPYNNETIDQYITIGGENGTDRVPKPLLDMMIEKMITEYKAEEESSSANKTELVGGVIRKILSKVIGIYDGGTDFLKDLAGNDDRKYIYNNYYFIGQNPNHKGRYQIKKNPFSDFGDLPIISSPKESNLSQHDIEDIKFDRRISTDLIVNDVAVTDNNVLPAAGKGDIVTLKVGSDRRILIAVSSATDHVIKGDHDHIKIYEDVMESRLYQTINCYRPEFLTALTIGDHTFLAYLEDRKKLNIFVYQPVKGFVEFGTKQFTEPASGMRSYIMPIAGKPFMCPRHFLVIWFGNQIEFVEAKTNGFCEFNFNEELCDLA